MNHISVNVETVSVCNSCSRTLQSASTKS